jgi:cytidylate kinase
MCTNLAPWTPFKFYVTASVKVRSLRRFKELRRLKKNITLAEVQKSIKKRDKSDRNRSIAPLIRAPNAILLNTSNLSIRSGILKIKKMIDKKLYN